MVLKWSNTSRKDIQPSTYTPFGIVSVRFAAKPSTENTVELTFEVANTGPAISEETAQELMAPFIQGGDKTYQFQGAGLGLTLSKKLAEMMQGQLHFAHDTEKGNIFSIRIYLELANS